MFLKICILSNLIFFNTLGWGSSSFFNDTANISLARKTLQRYSIKGESTEEVNFETALNPAKIIFKKHQLWEEYIRSNNLIARYFDQEKNKNQQKRTQYLKNSVEIIEQFNPDASTAIGECFRQRAETFIAFGKLDSAQIFLEKSHKIATHLLNWEELATVDVLYAVIAYYKKNFLTMEQTLNMALTISEENLDPANKLFHLIYQLLGVLHNTNGDFEKAIDIAQKSVETLLKLPTLSSTDSIYLSSKYLNLGAMYFNKGAYDQAILHYEKSLFIIARLNLRDSKLHNNLGRAYISKSNNEKGLFHFKESLKDQNHLEGRNVENYISSCINLGQYYLENQDVDSAFLYLNKAFKLKDINPYKQELIYLNLAQIHELKNDSVKAIIFFNDALEKSTKLYGKKSTETSRVLKYLGKFYLNKNNNNIALKYLQESLIAQVNDFNSTNYSQNPTFNGNKILLLATLSHKGQALLNKFHQEPEDSTLLAAQKTFLTAIQLIDTLRINYITNESKIDLVKDRRIIFDGAIEACFLLHQRTGNKTYLEEAFYLFEKSKSILLTEAIKDAEDLAHGEVPDSLLAEEKKIQIDLGFYQKRLNLAEEAKDSTKIELYETYLFQFNNTYEEIKRHIKEQYPDYHNFKYNFKTVKLKELQKHLAQNNTQLVQYFIGEKIAASICIEPNNIRGNYTNNLKGIGNQLIQFRDQVTTLSFNEFAKKDNFITFCNLGNSLYNILLGKYFDNNLENNQPNLVIIPDGGLGLIPFEALLYKSADTSVVNYQSLPYLIKASSISYAYSATLLAANNDSKTAVKNSHYLGFAPSYQSLLQENNTQNVLASLPGSQKEISTVTNYFKGTAFVGNNATRENFYQEAPNYGIIHLAMHGKADETNPNYSKLIFSANKKSNGELYNYELNGIKLNAQLVILSACETGFGQFYKGEGIMSLARNFMVAGSSSIITSLWSIPDQPTAILMENLYQNLSKGKAKGNALGAAKLAYLKKADNYSAHPYFWSGFVHIGANEEIFNQSINFRPLILIILGITTLIFLILFRGKIKKENGKKDLARLKKIPEPSLY